MYTHYGVLYTLYSVYLKRLIVIRIAQVCIYRLEKRVMVPLPAEAARELMVSPHNSDLFYTQICYIT